MRKSVLAIILIVVFAFGASLAVAEPSYDLDPMSPVEESMEPVSSNEVATVSNVVRTEDAKPATEVSGKEDKAVKEKAKETKKDKKKEAKKEKKAELKKKISSASKTASKKTAKTEKASATKQTKTKKTTEE